MMKTPVFDLGKPSPKVTDRWRSAYANAVIPGLVRIMITSVRQTETILAFFSTMRFYTQKIVNHFIGAKHKAKKNLFYILYTL